MKKHFTISFSFLILCLMISGCTSVNIEQKISYYKWEMEFVLDLDGNPLENDMTIIFNDDSSFVLADKSNDKEWKGKYMTEKVDSSYKLDLYCEDTGKTITGVYGTREYDDKKRIPSITLQTEDKIISFIANE